MRRGDVIVYYRTEKQRRDAMKKLFKAIRQGKLDEVAMILDKKPDLISCLAKAPPKKDDG